jgi:uncharacterized protein
MSAMEDSTGAKKRASDFLVNYRKPLVGVVVVITAVLSFFVPRLEMDPSLKSVLVTTSPAYFEYEKFLEVFEDEEFIVVAIKSKEPVADQNFLTALASITSEISKLDKVDQVFSITNLRFFQKKGETFGNYNFVRNEKGLLSVPERSDVEKIRKALPLLDLLVSPSLKTVGLLVRIDEQSKFDLQATQKIVTAIDALIKRYVPEGTESRVVGMAILRQAILNYSIKTALIFGILCTLICSVVTVYIFKSAKVTIVTMFILGICVLWVLGLMVIMGIPLNASTSLSFGLILITSLEIVIHMVARFNQFLQIAGDREQAVKETVRYLARPCLISSATTAVGFGSCMVTSIPMVFQLGFVMSLGITISFCLAMILTPAVLIAMKSLELKTQEEVSSDLLSRVLDKVKESISRRHKLYTVMGFSIAGVMLAGAPLIKTDPQIFRQLGESSPEVKDIGFVQENLTSVHSVQLVLEAQDNSFKKPEIWKKVRELEMLLRKDSEVVTTDSFLPFLEYMHIMAQGEGTEHKDLLASPGEISQLLLITGLTPDGKRMIRSHLDDTFKTLRISVRIKNSPSVPIVETIEAIRSTAQSIVAGAAGVTVTGEAVVVSAQGEDLVRSEIYSLFIAIAIITVLMMIQMGTPLFGLLSLVPNIPPLATVFGLMGYLRIPLDGVTVFAATVAIGLAVDNTIHFVAQLKREIKLNPELGVKECVFRAYSLAAKPMASWSVVTLLGFLALLVTPFQAAVYFGMLVSSAVLMGIFGDLVFMQSIILTFPAVQSLIRKMLEKEIAAGK